MCIIDRHDTAGCCSCCVLLFVVVVLLNLLLVYAFYFLFFLFSHFTFQRSQAGYRSLLEQQTARRAGEDVNLTGLSEIERKLNASLLQQALNDPTVVAKLANHGKAGK